MTRWSLRLSLLLALAACGSNAPIGGDLPLEPAGVAPERVVAHVNGVPLLREDLEEQLRAGRPRRQALQSLIQAELLAQEAARRGLGHRPAVAAEQRRAMASLLIRREIIDKFTTKDVPRTLVEKAYKNNWHRYQRPATVAVLHILAHAQPQDPPELHSRALQIARRVRGIAASGPLSETEFKGIAGLVAKEDPTLRVRAEELTTPLRGHTVPEFADAAFALTRPGQISPVVRTAFGYHVIYLKQRFPAIDLPLSAVEDEVRGKLLEPARGEAFQRWAEQLARTCRVQINTEQLDERRR